MPVPVREWRCAHYDSDLVKGEANSPGVCRVSDDQCCQLTVFPLALPEMAREIGRQGKDAGDQDPLPKADETGQVCAAENNARNQNGRDMAERRWNEEKRYICSQTGNNCGCTDASDRTPILQRPDAQCRELGGARIQEGYCEKVPDDEAGHRAGHSPHLASGITRQQSDRDRDNTCVKEIGSLTKH